MAKPPPLPGRSGAGPPPLPSGVDPGDWLTPLMAMGLEHDTEAPIQAGLNLRGTVDGHIVKVHASRRSRTRYAGEIRYRSYHGHRIEISVTTSVMTRCAISRPANAFERWAARTNRWFGAAEVERKGEACDFLTIWATEKRWVEPFLNRSDVQEKIQILFPESDLPPNVGLKWWPGFLTYSQRIDITRVNAAKMTRWVRSLVELAALAEASPPTVEVPLNRWERWSLDQPILAGCAVVGSLFAIVIIIGLAVTAALIGLSFAMSR
ncbi:MAG: hypothetical protein P1U86_17340 [Verrucomicrobiales bacterium]|nr:hypothetical protein [Verrucomicrobiales bacterium]